MIDIAAIMNQLMIDLGFGSRYIAQGGDIGSRVAKTLGGEYEACKGKITYSTLSYILEFGF
jgi:microsomal epoxide hydrolase